MAPPALVIDLSLDDDPAPLVASAAKQPRPRPSSSRKSKPAADICILSDDSHEAAAVPPRKKQKVTPPPTKRKSKFAFIEDFISSDDDDDPPPLHELLKATRTPATNRASASSQRKPTSTSRPNGTSDNPSRDKGKGKAKATSASQRPPHQSIESHNIASDHPDDETPTIFTFKADPSPHPGLINGPQQSERAASLLAHLDEAGEWVGWEPTPRRQIGRPSASRAAAASQRHPPGASLASARPAKDSFSNASASASPPKPKGKKSEAEKEAAKAAREAAKAAKLAEKEAAKAAKAHEKERAAALTEANKRKTDKNVSTAEMLMDIPTSMSGSTLATHIAASMELLGVPLGEYTAPAPNLIRWRRKVCARYNEALDHWEPCKETIETESTVLLWITAEDFVKRAVAEAEAENSALSYPQDTISALVADVRRASRTIHPAAPTKVLYMIEGLSTWQKRNKSAANRAYTAAITRMPPPNDPASSSASTSRKRKPARPPRATVDESLIEDALLSLQVTHGIKMHHTTSPSDSAAWLAHFTQQVAVIPYRAAQAETNLATNFCMDVGQIKTAASASDTYLLLLQEIGRVTQGVALGIVAEYPTLRGLMGVLEREGPTALQDIRKLHNRNGMPTSDRVGPAISKRVWKIFRGEDQGSFDV